MKTLFLFICLLASGSLMPLSAHQATIAADTTTSGMKAASPAATNLTMFGRGIYPGDDTTYTQLKSSGFTTVILSSFYIHSNGDVYSGDDHTNPIIHDGKFVGSKEWLKRVASLKQGTSTVTRTEILLEGRWFNQPPNTYDYIQDWYDAAKKVPGIVTGIGVNSTLYTICKIFKEDIGVDAVCIDDESVYNSESIAQLGEMVGQLGIHMTLCPFRKTEYWKDVICRSKPGLIDAVYLQCYDGGRNNVPGDWKTKLNTELPVYPIFLCRGAFSNCGPVHNSKSPADIKTEMIRFRKDYPGMSGGAIWQLADVKSYIKSNCAVQAPESGTAATVAQYITDLKNSLQEGLENQ
ncbi:hypothetical protein [Chitinophaga pinensis]|uniref:S1D (Lysyl endopeptidase) subfamily C-terminal domain protein n=1 Tax=Chitinophaga pinensis (strain ATCC 43595 / DSM 2588 / LMG 13176 / NBRC 15968 / NCIMB 11800 / UQM 2034) TaxID=485918 RepID=A0A979GYE9_CHIPD|nr:hypothetical protein [Chitinophaga pinensis]ACU63154.1 S1D (lysyl endopeptidase) subfamily C-terminal domain protein [Chitinophaga pinensis DSM 2588]